MTRLCRGRGAWAASNTPSASVDMTATVRVAHESSWCCQDTIAEVAYRRGAVARRLPRGQTPPLQRLGQPPAGTLDLLAEVAMRSILCAADGVRILRPGVRRSDLRAERAAAAEALVKLWFERWNGRRRRARDARGAGRALRAGRAAPDRPVARPARHGDVPRPRRRAGAGRAHRRRRRSAHLAHRHRNCARDHRAAAPRDRRPVGRPCRRGAAGRRPHRPRHAEALGHARRGVLPDRRRQVPPRADLPGRGRTRRGRSRADASPALSVTHRPTSSPQAAQRPLDAGDATAMLP